MPVFSDASKFVVEETVDCCCLLLTEQLIVTVVVAVICTDSFTAFIQKLLVVVPEETKVD